MRLRPNPSRITNGFERACVGMVARWPELTVEG